LKTKAGFEPSYRETKELFLGKRRAGGRPLRPHRTGYGYDTETVGFLLQYHKPNFLASTYK